MDNYDFFKTLFCCLTNSKDAVIIAFETVNYIKTHYRHHESLLNIADNVADFLLFTQNLDKLHIRYSLSDVHDAFSTATEIKLAYSELGDLVNEYCKVFQCLKNHKHCYMKSYDSEGGIHEYHISSDFLTHVHTYPDGDEAEWTSTGDIRKHIINAIKYHKLAPKIIIWHKEILK